jgi:hypothetical protein
MTTVLQPGATSTDVVSGFGKSVGQERTHVRWGKGTLTALAVDLDEDREVSGGFSVPRLERRKELEARALRVNGDVDLGAIGRRGLEGILTRVVAAGREFISTGV